MDSAHHIGKSGAEAGDTTSKTPTSKTPLEQPGIRHAFAKLPKDPQDKVYARMAAKFHIHDVRTLKNSVTQRTDFTQLTSDNTTANILDRDTLISYSAEMEFIKKSANDLLQAINDL